MKDIKGFTGKYSFLSNMYPCTLQCSAHFKWKSSEHFYQASKAIKRSDFLYINKLVSPRESKVYARKMPVVNDWHSIKDGIMFRAIMFKFHQNHDLREMLFETGDAYIEETNTLNDTYWGVCNGKGLNKLGKLLMKVRYSLQNNLESVKNSESIHLTKTNEDYTNG